MINYLHDIRNKLTLISGHTSLLAKKYGAEEFAPINTNIMRINELVNEAYLHLNADKDSACCLSATIKDFLNHLDGLANALKLTFPIEIQNEVTDYRPATDFEIDYNANNLFQILENAIGNSLNANATKVYVRVLDVGNFCIMELVDNGHGKSKETPELQKASLIPHGLGTKIITKNMQNMNGKAEWAPRFDGTGMVLRLYFPIKFLKS